MWCHPACWALGKSPSLRGTSGPFTAAARRALIGDARVTPASGSLWTEHSGNTLGAFSLDPEGRRPSRGTLFDFLVCHVRWHLQQVPFPLLVLSTYYILIYLVGCSSLSRTSLASSSALNAPVDLWSFRRTSSSEKLWRWHWDRDQRSSKHEGFATVFALHSQLLLNLLGLLHILSDALFHLFERFLVVALTLFLVFEFTS